MVIAERKEYYVALIDPDFLSELASDVGKALFAVEAESFQAAVAEHLDYLGILYVAECVRYVVGGFERRCTLALLFESELTLFVVILVLSTTSIFTTLENVLAASSLHARCVS